MNNLPNLQEHNEQAEWATFLQDVIDLDKTDDQLQITTDNTKFNFEFPNNYDKKSYLKIMKQKFHKAMNPEVPNKCLFITFNFDDTKLTKFGVSNLPDLMKTKILVKRCFQKRLYYYNIEQRSEINDVYSGFHIHLLIDRPKKAPSHLKRELFQTLKGYLGNPKHIDIRYYNGCDVFREKLQYLQGIKNDDSKFAKTINDQLFRKKFQFQKIYSSFD